MVFLPMGSYNINGLVREEGSTSPSPKMFLENDEPVQLLERDKKLRPTIIKEIGSEGRLVGSLN